MLAVLAYHAGFDWARGGFLGVSLFFTLSGFLVGSVLFREIDQNGRVDLKRFWARRLRRLQPAAVVALLGAVAYGATVATPSQADSIPGHVIASLFNVSNWLFILEDTGYVGLFALPSPLQHFWSLAIEWQFYVLLPLGLTALERRRRHRGGQSSAVFLLVVWGALTSWSWQVAASQGFERVYFGTDTRLAELLAGVVLAAVCVRPPTALRAIAPLLSWAGPASVAVLLLMMVRTSTEDLNLWRGGMALFSACAAVTVLTVVRNGDRLRALGARPLVVTGRISYGLYLYHFPIFLWLTPDRTGLGQWPLFGLRLALTFTAAAASYRLVEIPVRAGSAIGRTARMQVTALVASTAVVGTAGLVLVADDQPAAIFGGAPAAMPDLESDPVLDLLVISDPSGRALVDAVSARADHRLNVSELPLPPCDRLVQDEAGASCEGWTGGLSDAVAREDPDVIVLHLDRWPGPTDAVQGGGEPASIAIDEAMRSMVEELGAGGNPVLWVRSGPDIDEVAARRADPFHRSMTGLAAEGAVTELTLDFVRDPSEPAFVRRSVEAVLERSRLLHRRAGTSDRVMFVGDSQVQTIAHGLERWAAEREGSVVWDAARAGCGIVPADWYLDLFSNEPTRANAACTDVLADWSAGLERFEPGMVVVMSSLRDLQSVMQDGWPDFAAPGSEAYDGHVVEAYTRLVDALGAGGAEVVWLLPPCIRFVDPLTGRTDPPPTFDPFRVQHMRDVILPALQAQRPSVRFVDIGDDLCPDGEFLESVDGVGPIRPDGLHLTPESSDWLAAKIAPELFAGQ